MEITINIPDSLTFILAGEERTLPASEMSEASLLGLFMYGRRKANDTFNSKKDSESPLTRDQVLDKIKAWDFGSAGTRVGELTTIQRRIVADHLITLGHKVTIAREIAKDPKEGFESYLLESLAGQLNVPQVEVDKDLLEQAMEINWPQVEEEAERIQKASKTSIGVDLSGLIAKGMES